MEGHFRPITHVVCVTPCGHVLLWRKASLLAQNTFWGGYSSFYNEGHFRPITHVACVTPYGHVLLCRRASLLAQYASWGGYSSFNSEGHFACETPCQVLFWWKRVLRRIYSSFNSDSHYRTTTHVVCDTPCQVSLCRKAGLLSQNASWRGGYSREGHFTTIIISHVVCVTLCQILLWKKRLLRIEAIAPLTARATLGPSLTLLVQLLVKVLPSCNPALATELSRKKQKSGMLENPLDFT